MMMTSINGTIYAMQPGRKPIRVEQIDPQKAAHALEQQGCRAELAAVVAYGGLDGDAARRLGRKYGLLIADSR
jgi:hypothetical protein